MTLGSVRVAPSAELGSPDGPVHNLTNVTGSAAGTQIALHGAENLC